MADSRHFEGVDLIGLLTRRKFVAHLPALTNDQEGVVNLVDTHSDLVHGVHVNNAH